MLGFRPLLGSRLRPLRSAFRATFCSTVIAGLLLTGCDPEALDPSLDPNVAGLSERHACADLILVAATPEGDEGLFLTIDDGLVDEVIGSGMPSSARYDVGDERIELRWVRGSNVYAGHCGLDSGEPWHVDEVEQAIAGEILVELTPSDDAIVLDVELEGVLLSPLAAGQTKQGPARALPSMAMHELQISR